MAKLRTEHDVSLTVIGRAKEGGPSAKLIDQLGLGDHIEFVTGVPDERIVELYAQSELAVVPSLYEGFSLPAVEAMATATPLVATDGGALPEVTGVDGETVLRCDPGDADSLDCGPASGPRRPRPASPDRRRPGGSGSASSTPGATPPSAPWSSTARCWRCGLKPVRVGRQAGPRQAKD